MNEQSTIEPVNTIDFSAEDKLDRAAEIILAVGLVAAVVIFMTIGLKAGESTLYLEDARSEVEWKGLAISFCVAFLGVIGHYLIKALGNVSRSVKTVNLGKVVMSQVA